MAKVEMSQVREENQRLKKSLDQMMKDYESLKRQFHDITTQREGKKSTQTSASTINNDEVEEVDDMVSLTLGRFSSCDQNKNNTSSERKLDHKLLELKTPSNNDHIQSPTDSEAKDQEEAGETWPPSKALKGLPAPATGEDEVSQQNPPKKTRVCVRARCDTPTVSDYTFGLTCVFKCL